MRLLGSVIAGHHNIAWELLGDGRFDPRIGILREAFAEIERAELPIVLLTSEDHFPALVGGRGAEAFAVIALSSLACVSLLYFGVERPFMNLRDRFDRGRSHNPDRIMLDEPAL